MRSHRFIWIPLAAALCAPAAFAEEDVPAAISEFAQQDASTPARAASTSADTGAAPAAGSVARAVFTREIVDREPGAAVTALPATAREVFFFTELRDLAGQTVTHRWEHAGAVLAEVAFEVKGPRWRVHSSKQLMPGWGGEWKVSVLDGEGRVLRTESFEYEEPAADAPGDME